MTICGLSRNFYESADPFVILQGHFLDKLEDASLIHGRSAGSVRTTSSTLNNRR